MTCASSILVSHFVACRNLLAVNADPVGAISFTNYKKKKIPTFGSSPFSHIIDLSQI